MSESTHCLPNIYFCFFSLVVETQFSLMVTMCLSKSTQFSTLPPRQEYLYDIVLDKKKKHKLLAGAFKWR